MKVYEIQIGDHKTWMCANTNIEALKKHEEMTGMMLVDFEKEDSIVEIPRKKWKDYRIIYDESNESKPTTFEQYMKTAESADMIASNVYY